MKRRPSPSRLDINKLLRPCRILAGALLTLSLTACSSDKKFVPASLHAVTALEELSEQAPKTVIDLDAVPTDTLYPDLVIGSEDPESDELFIGQTFGAALRGDSIYVADRDQGRILVGHKDEPRFARSFGTTGEGPGEFMGPQDLVYNRDRFFVMDTRSGMVIVFDSTFTFEQNVEVGTAEPWAFTLNPYGLLSASPIGSDKIAEIHDVEPPFRVVSNFLSALVPFDDPANGYNRPLIDSNSHGEILAAYSGVPHLFLHSHSLELTASIELRGEAVLRVNSPEMGGFNRYRINTFYSTLTLSDRGTIYFIVPSTLYELRADGGSYRLTRTSRLSIPRDEATGNGSDFVFPLDLELDDEGHLYAISPFKSRIFRYLIPGPD